MSSPRTKDTSNPDLHKIDLSFQNLNHPNRQNIKAKISKTWHKTLILLSSLIAFLSGLSAAYSGGLMGHIITHNADEFSLFSLAVIGIITLFIVVTYYKGWGETAEDLAIIILTSLLLITLFIAIIAFSPENTQGFNIALGANFTLLASLGIIAAIVNYAIAFTLAKLILNHYSTRMIISFNLLGAMIGALCGVTEFSSYMIAIFTTLITLIVGTNVGRQTIKRKAKYRLLLWLTLTLTMIGQENLNANEIIDLSLDNPVNPKIAAIAIEQLLKQYPLDLFALEGKSQQELRLYAKVRESRPSQQISQDFEQIYHQLASSPSPLQHSEEDDQLQTILTNTLRENNYVTVNVIYNQEGGITMTQSSDKSNQVTTGRDFNLDATNSVVNLGKISGDVSNTINQLPDYTNPNQPNIRDILKQLQTAIETESELDEDDKIQALEQVKTLAEASQNPQESKMQKLAKGAKNTLKGIVSNLPDAAKLVESVNQLLPTILKIFGLSL